MLDAPELEQWLEPLMARSASSNSWIAVSHRLKYAHLLRSRGEVVKAAALAAESEGVARAALDQQPDTTELRVELAAVSALRQDSTATLDWLQRAYDGGYCNSNFLERDPILREQLGTDPCFGAFVDRMRSDVAAQRERASARRLLELSAVLKTEG